MSYKINVKEVQNYIEYLKKFKKNLIINLEEFNSNLKRAHQYWDDENYELTIEAKEKVAKEQAKLIESIDISIKKLKAMAEQYDIYLSGRRHL
jgi:hypothetical protein